MQGYLYVKTIDSSACIRAAPQVSITAWRKMTPWHGNTALIAGPLWWNPPVTCDSPCVRGQQSGALICWLVEQAVGHTVVICYAILSSVHVASLQWYLDTGDPCMDSNNRDMSDSLVLQIYTPNLTDQGPALLTLKSFYRKAFSRKHGCDWLMLKHQPITAKLSAKSF